jgi:CPA2 family monovalent cation:H+ antiporter-2
VFEFCLAVSVVTLILTPYAISAAPALTVALLRRLPRGVRTELESARTPAEWKRVVVVGYGPAGQEVVARLVESGTPLIVLEMNPLTVAEYRSRISIELGDATQREVLQHAGVGQSLAVVVTIPDPGAARLICEAVARLAPGVPLIVRSRYHRHTPALEQAGAGIVADEEELVGRILAAEAIHAVEDKSGTRLSA